jgi:hypothetical protein
MHVLDINNVAVLFANLETNEIMKSSIGFG